MTAFVGLHGAAHRAQLKPGPGRVGLRPRAPCVPRGCTRFRGRWRPGTSCTPGRGLGGGRCAGGCWLFGRGTKPAWLGVYAAMRDRQVDRVTLHFGWRLLLHGAVVRCGGATVY